MSTFALIDMLIALGLIIAMQYVQWQFSISTNKTNMIDQYILALLLPNKLRHTVQKKITFCISHSSVIIGTSTTII